MKKKHQDLVDYWELKINESHMGIDWAEAHNHCWRCGEGVSSTSRLERAHIIPDSLGGLDKPENLVLLCNLCHNEAPDIADKNVMWDWIKRTSSTHYEEWCKLRLHQEFKNLFGIELFEQLKKIPNFKRELFTEELNKKYSKTSTHSGRFKYSTRAYAIKSVIDMVIIN